MVDDNTTNSYPATRFKNGESHKISLELIGEEPLLIRVDDKPYAVVMRTPGNELFHAAGFCLGEGIADSPDDFTTIGYCKDMDPNVIDVRLTPKRRENIKGLLNRRGFVSQTSCGICGKEMLKDIYQILSPSTDDFKVGLKDISDGIRHLFGHQKFYERTRGSHAAILFDRQMKVTAFAEDVGRHNALDKAIGRAFMEGSLENSGIVALSSRISYELVQKAARAKLSVMISKSRPTGLAAEMGRGLNMTLAFPSGSSEVVVVCGQNRVHEGGP